MELKPQDRLLLLNVLPGLLAAPERAALVIDRLKALSQ